MRALVRGAVISSFVLPFVVVTVASAADSEGLELAPPVEFFPSVGSPEAVALADFTGDGNLDAAVVGFASAKYGCYTGTGTGTFSEEIFSGSLYLDPIDVVVGDFNGDGVLDIAAINNACLA